MRKTLLLLILTTSTIFLSGCWETESGQKTGNIVKFSKEGFLIKTYEAELIRGGMNDGSGSIGKSFHFTVENKSLIETINKAISTNKQVKINYHQEWYTLPWRCESQNYFLDNIEILN